jgi:hypothetical protein
VAACAVGALRPPTDVVVGQGVLDALLRCYRRVRDLGGMGVKKLDELCREGASCEEVLEATNLEMDSLKQQLAALRELREFDVAKLAAKNADAERYSWLVANSFDKEGVTQIHLTAHTWEPHSVTGEPTEWSARIRGPAIDREIDKALAATEPK